MPTFELAETIATEVQHIQREIKIPYCHHMNCGKETPTKAVLFLGMSIGVLNSVSILGNDRTDVT